MPLEGAPLAEWCGGPASLCEAVKKDCSKCMSINKDIAEQRRAEAQGKESKE